jgi:hypothetical protein
MTAATSRTRAPLFAALGAVVNFVSTSSTSALADVD